MGKHERDIFLISHDFDPQTRRVRTYDRLDCASFLLEEEDLPDLARESGLTSQYTLRILKNLQPKRYQSVASIKIDPPLSERQAINLANHIARRIGAFGVKFFGERHEGGVQIELRPRHHVS